MDREYAEYLLKKTKEDYNLIAEDFSNKRENIWEETEFLFDDYLSKGMKILDLGCGNGRYYPVFKAKKIDYSGIDNSEQLINIAKEKYPEAKFKLGDALNIPFSDNFFDRVYSIAVLHHIPSKELRIQSLKEIRKVLKNNGLLILTVWKFHELKEFYFLIKYTILKLIMKSKLDWNDVFEPWGRKAQRYYHWFSRKELEKLAMEAGFKVKKMGIVKNRKGNRKNIYLVVEKL